LPEVQGGGVGAGDRRNQGVQILVSLVLQPSGAAGCPLTCAAVNLVRAAHVVFGIDSPPFPNSPNGRYNSLMPLEAAESTADVDLLEHQIGELLRENPELGDFRDAFQIYCMGKYSEARGRARRKGRMGAGRPREGAIWDIEAAGPRFLDLRTFLLTLATDRCRICP
jgi:hypothetical protein